MKHLNNYITEALIKNHTNITNLPYIDLELPSGTLWATCNLGANKPEEYGNYYIWGSTKDNSKDYCDWKNTPFNDGSNSYNNDAWQKNKSKAINSNNILLPENDAATVLLGLQWRMPTKEEVTELFEGTDRLIVTCNSVKGFMLTSKYNKKLIFFPSAGIRFYDEIKSNTDAVIWTSSASETFRSDALSLRLNGWNSDIYRYDRHYGLNIRPIFVK